jgi:hypothetical protein
MSWFLAPAAESGQNKRPGKPDLLKFISAISASTSVVKDAKTNYSLGSLKLISSHFAGLVVTDEFEADLLTVIEAAHASALNGRDVYEHIS